MRTAKPGLRVIRVVIYARVSEDDLRKKRSVGEQEQECREDADTRAWRVDRVFIDNDRSASRFARKEREQYPLLLEYLATGQVDILILWESSRGDRELERWARLLNLCRKMGVKIHIHTHGRTYDLDNPRDWRTLAEDGVDSAYEVEKHRERVMRSKRAAARAGRPAGKLLYGYQREYDGRGRFIAQVIREDQAAVIREAARRVRAGESCYSIAQDLNTRGVPTPRREPLMRKAAENRNRAEKERDLDNEARAELLAEAEQWEQEAAALRWDLTQVRRLVTNPAYIGQRTFQGQVIGPAIWPAILEEQVYTDCVSRLSDPGRRTWRDSTVKHLLSGPAVADPCGGRLRVQKNRSYYTYICVRDFCVAVKTTWVEQFVVDLVVRRLERPDLLELMTDPQADDGAARARTELAELNARMEAFYEQAEAGKLSAAGLAKMEARLLPKIEAAEQRTKVVPISPLLRQVAGPDAAKRWAKLTIGQRRELVGTLAEIRVGGTYRGARRFEPARLANSRWRWGDSRTWGEIWRESGSGLAA